MKAEEEDRLAEESRLKVEKHDCAQLKIEEEVRLALEEIWRAEEEEEHNG